MAVAAEYVLPLDCTMARGESVQGLLVRIAEAMHCESPSWLAGPAGTPLPLVPGQDPAWVVRLSRMSRVPEAELLAGAYPPAGEGLVSVGGVAFPQRAVAAGRPRVCPACLAEAPFRRLAWELLPMQVCPRHRCRLLARCPGCGHGLSWSMPSVLRCRCGFALSLTEAEAVDEANVMAAREVGIRLGLEDGGTALAEPFASMPVTDLLVAFGFLGRTALAAETGEDFRKSTLMRPDAHVILSAGARTCARWPDAFFEALDRRMARTGLGRGIGVQAAFGAVYVSVMRGGDAGCWPVMREALVEYLRRRPDLPVGMPRRLLAFGTRTSNWVDLDGALGILGLTRRQAERLKGKKCWESIPTRGTAKRRLYDRVSVEAFAATLSKLVSLTDMARTLGMDRRRVNLILRCGLFEVLDVAVHGKRAVAINPDQVLGFLRRLEGAARRPGPVTDPLSFRGAVASAIQRGVGMPMLMGLMGSGALVPKARESSAQGFDALVFERTEVEGALAGLMAMATDTIAVAETAQAIGLSIAETSLLVRCGVLTSVPGVSSTAKGSRIPREEVERFREEFVTGRDLAREAGYVRRPKHWRPLSADDQRAAGLELVAVVGQSELDVYRRVGPRHSTGSPAA